MTPWAARRAAYWRNPGSRLGLPVALVICALALYPAAWLPWDPTQISLGDAKQPGFWSGELRHPLGTDFLGRDLLARTVHGARLTLLISGSAVLVATALGLTLGLAAGFYRGWVDEWISWLGRPAGLPGDRPGGGHGGHPGGGLVTLVGVLAFTSWSTMARVVRAQTLSARTEPYVEAARALGRAHREPPPAPHPAQRPLAAPGRRHLRAVPAGADRVGPELPGAGGVPAGRDLGRHDRRRPTVHLRRLVDGRRPGLMIASLVFAFNFVGDGLRDALDPTSWRLTP